MKKIVLLILFAALCIMPSTVSAQWSEEDGIVSLLKDLEIMQGDENGDMGLDRLVSRAEFAKIAVAASSEKDTVALGLQISPYRDVPYTRWYAPYIKAAMSAGYVQGYLDGTYRPDNTVTYEEAISIMLRVLGYNDSAFGAAYPYGQIAKAQGLDLTDGVDGGIGTEMTRRQVMRLVYNTLLADVTVSTSTQTTTTSAGSASQPNANTQRTSQSTTTVGTSSYAGSLLGSHNCTMTEDADVIAGYAQDNSLGTDKIFTSAGTYTKGDYFSDECVGMTGNVFVKNSRDIIAFVPDTAYENNDYETYFVYSTLPNAVVGYRNGNFETIDIPDSATVYENQSPTMYSLVKDNMEMGDTMYVKRTSGGSIDYITYESSAMEGPVRVTSRGQVPNFPSDANTTVMRGGVKASMSDLQSDDIVYYSPNLNIVLAYTDKVTGVYENASPTKDAPASVTVSGTDYPVESVEAFNDLSSSGKYNYGDTVTLLLGRNRAVAGVSGAGSGAAVSASSGATGGFVTETGKKDFKNPDNTVYTSYYAKVVTSDGIMNEYETANDYSSFVCSAVRISFKNGKATLKRVNDNGGVYGKVNAKAGTIGDYDLADDVKILDTSGTHSDDTPGYCKIYPQRIDNVTLTSSNVLYSLKNGAGEIKELILKDVTGDTYTYGIIVSKGESGMYTINIDGSQTTYMTSFSTTATGPHRFKMNGSNIDNMVQLPHYSQYVSQLTRTEAVIGQQTYLLSDKVVVYNKELSSPYMKITLDDAINGNYRLTAYYDKAESSGGRIRIIIAERR